jgi:hypothetical protein
MLRSLFSTFLMLVTILILLPLLILIIPACVFIKLCYSVEKIRLIRVAAWSRIIKFHPELGWKPRENLSSVTYSDRIGDLCTVSTCHDGWPTPERINESNIIVFGDSFAFGYGANERDAYYALGTEKMKPIAAPGYNMAQAVLLMKKYRMQLKGKSVVWMICLENDLAENIRMDNFDNYMVPFVKQDHGTGEWDIMNRHLISRKWLYGESSSKNTLRYAAICTDSVYSERVFQVCDYLIGEAKKVMESVGASLTVYTIPDKRQLSSNGLKTFERHLRLAGGEGMDADLPDRELMKICEKRDIPMICGKDHLTEYDYKARDGHWNKKGNRKVCEQILSHLLSTEEKLIRRAV